MKNFFKKIDTFHLIFILFGIIFSFILFFSIPTIFSYQDLFKKIEKTIESDFNIKILGIKDVKYRFIPSPHLVISNAKLYLDSKEKNLISELTDVKLHISILNLYNSKNIKVKKIILEEENFYLNHLSLINVIKHIYEKKSKDIIIKKSKFFIVDKSNEVSTISPLKKFKYQTNIKSNQKKINITGNIFDTDYDFKWDDDPNRKNSSRFIMKFKNPNILLQNNLKILENNKRQGQLKLSFLSNKLDLEYKYDKNEISLTSKQDSNSPFSISGNINLNPFFFNFNTDLKDQKIDVLIKYLLLNYFNFKERIHPNLNGTISINLENIKNAYLNNGFLKFNFNNSKITIDDNKLNVRNIGEIVIKNNSFYEVDGNVFFSADLILNITDQKEFYRRFSIPIKNRINLNKIFLTVEKNIDNDSYLIYNFFINNNPINTQNKQDINNIYKYQFDNFQKFRNVIKENFNRTS